MSFWKIRKEDKVMEKNYKSFSMELAGRTLTVDVGRVAKQANGAAFMHYGDTVVLSTATASDKPREGIDFFPLSVEYEEKMYSVGKIPGGFNRREGKASENAILTSRVIDRPILSFQKIIEMMLRSIIWLCQWILIVRQNLRLCWDRQLPQQYQIFHLTDHVQLHRLV